MAHSTLKMKVVHYPETSVNFYRALRPHIQKRAPFTINTVRTSDPKIYIFIFFIFPVPLPYLSSIFQSFIRLLPVFLHLSFQYCLFSFSYFRITCIRLFIIFRVMSISISFCICLLFSSFIFAYNFLFSFCILLSFFLSC